MFQSSLAPRARLQCSHDENLWSGPRHGWNVEMEKDLISETRSCVHKETGSLSVCQTVPNHGNRRHAPCPFTSLDNKLGRLHDQAYPDHNAASTSCLVMKYRGVPQDLSIDGGIKSPQRPREIHPSTSSRR